MAENESDFLPQLLSCLGTLEPPADFVESFWRRVAQEDEAEASSLVTASQLTARHLTADIVDEEVAPAGHGHVVATIGDGGQVCMEETVPTTVLARVRAIAETLVVASGGSTGEADWVGVDVAAYVDVYWSTLRLNVLAQDALAWERHILRTTYRRWLSRLLAPGSSNGWSAPMGVSVTRARMRALSDAGDVPAEDRLLFDHIYNHCFSVTETAMMFSLDPLTLIERLRAVWSSLRAASAVVEIPGEVTLIQRPRGSSSGPGPLGEQGSWPAASEDESCYRALTSILDSDGLEVLELPISETNSIGPKRSFGLGRWDRRGSSDIGSIGAYPRGIERHCPADETDQSRGEADRNESGESDPMSASTTIDPTAELRAESHPADDHVEILAADLLNLLAERLPEVHRLVVSGIVRRGYPRQDAEDVAQDVMEKVLARPERFAKLLLELEANKGYFVTMGLNVYLMRLRAEKRRRQREERHGGLGFGSNGLDDFDDHVIHDLVDAAPLTPLQRAYVTAVFDEHLQVDDIAARTGTTPRAVRAVLQRAGECIRRYLHLLRSD